MTHPSDGSWVIADCGHMSNKFITNWQHNCWRRKVRMQQFTHINTKWYDYFGYEFHFDFVISSLGANHHCYGSITS